jgi:hypothetical protein
MAQSNLLQLFLNGTAPKNLRILGARGSVPLPPKDSLEILVHLTQDTESEISSQAVQTLACWNKEELIGCLNARDCSPSVLEYFAGTDKSAPVIQAIIMNPAAPGKIIESLSLSVSAQVLEKILENRVRMLECPVILENVRNNPNATPEIRRLVGEIESEYFGSKKKEYAIHEPDGIAPSIDQILLESDLPLEDLSLEGLPIDEKTRQAELGKRISCLSLREKVRYALFGNREIRTFLVRDTNKEVARSVLRSPKLTENEIEGIAAMRGVTEDILREIGNSRQWTKNRAVVQNLVRNPKTPPVVSQRLLPQLQTRDLTQLSRDRSIPDAVRYNATRTLNQRTGSRK